MKTLVLIAATSFLFGSFTPTQTEVYLCMGPDSERYHFNPNCQGLSRCSTQLAKMSLDEAIEEYGRTLCGHED